MSVQIMSRLIKSIRTPPTGPLEGPIELSQFAFTLTVRKYAPLPDHTSSLMYNLYSALFSHCKYFKSTRMICRFNPPGEGLSRTQPGDCG